VRISEPMREEIRGSRRRLHNEDFHQIYASPKIGWTGHVTRMEDMRHAYKILIGKAEGKRPTRKT